MKKLLVTSILCTAVFCGCSAKESSEISETSIPETSSVSVTESSAAVTETETAAEKAAVTKPAEEEIILTQIPSKEPFEVMSCRITDNIMLKSEEDFPDKETLKLAREICFADEEIREEIDKNNINAEEFYLAEEVDAYRIKSAEDMIFNSGCTFDFDSDGEDESLICLGYTQPAMGSALSGNVLIYTDGEEYSILEKHIASGASAQLIYAGEYVFLLSYVAAGASYYCEDIYSFAGGMPEKVINCDGAKDIYYENGAFYCEIKFTGTFPFLLCSDGIFRQLGREKISREDFEAHVQNGGAYLDSLAENGDNVTDIYTYGNYIYELCGEGFCYNTYRIRNVFKTERHNRSSLPEEVRFTDEVIYGDVWAVQPTRSPDCDIGGGYVCYTTGEAGNKILNVAKDNIITDSIKVNGFDPNWQIHFYDMDTPPCFALNTKGINYRTYFVIDGKITEMNWTLDGERLDTVDYTMLQCRGEGNEFVSYSIPIWEDDRFVKRHFTFADGDYTNIVGYSEEIDGEIIKWWDTDSGTSSETANEIMRKFCGFWSDAYRGETSYDGNERWLLLIEEEGFRTKEEMMNTLLEFCTLSAAEEVYAMLLENRYPDFEIIDGRIYLHEGAPNNYLPYYYVESAKEKDGVITAKFFAYYSGQDIPYRILPPLYAEFVRDDGVWKISSLPKEKQPTP